MASTERKTTPGRLFTRTAWRELQRSGTLGTQGARAENDGYGIFFAALGDLVVTGPTLTNGRNDFRAILVLDQYESGQENIDGMRRVSAAQRLVSRRWGPFEFELPIRSAGCSEAGVDVFRLNFSHGTHDDHRARFTAIRQVETATGRPIGILADLQGPKLRLGTFAMKGRSSSGGRRALPPPDLDRQAGDERRAPLPHPEIFEALQPGTELLLDDGRVRLEVEACGSSFADTRCLVGGTLSDRKGVNVPNAVLPLSAITEVATAPISRSLLEHGADWIAFSFVQRPDDVAEGRKLVGGRAGVMVKLEKPSAIQHLHEIIELADGLMVARGDLGVEMPPEDVPSVQKQVASTLAGCRAGKPVVVATQMLESMVAAPTSTRAEASGCGDRGLRGSRRALCSPPRRLRGRYPDRVRLR